MVKKLLQYFDLRKEVEDFNKIHDDIEKGIAFKGTNLWILVFAIIVASVGLNTNSTAVIIGAMLISPLMGPINGMGYSIATYNFDLFKRALKNFGFAVAAGLLASTIYFTISPVSTAHSELLARTSPTIYDVLIAMFGGLAGIIALGSKQKGNVIPGVAIATALMPPLCTAGYGLGTGQINFFLGAFYLFTINTVFIALSSIIISQILKFPIAGHVDSNQKKKVNKYITFIILITLLPSLYFGYVLVLDEKFNENASKFITNVTVVDGSYLLKNEVNARKKTIRLVYGGNSLTDANKKSVNDKTKDFNLDDIELVFEQGFSTDKESNTENEILKNQLSALSHSLNESELRIDSILSKPLVGKDLLKEIKTFYPQISSVSFSETILYNDGSDAGINTALVLLTTKIPLSHKDKSGIDKWLKVRLKRVALKTCFEEMSSINAEDSEIQIPVSN